MAEKDGGMAFPVPATDSNYFYEGMSLRDYFAAKAMQGICSHTDTWGLSVPEIANKAYWIANEMLAARSK